MSHIQECFTLDLLDHPQHGAQLRMASCFVGMHPDQATECIVDAALLLGKPFAVVPCCVFAILFPTRRLAENGRPVRLHSDFCRYLESKHPCALSHQLAMRGRNTIVYLNEVER